MSVNNPRVVINSPSNPFTPSGHIEVAIVGAGASGLSCALHLHDRAIECAVFERDDIPSGSTSLSSGFIPAPCTRLQTRLNINDSVELFVLDIRNKSKGKGNQILERAYASAIGPALDALEMSHGFDWEILDQFLYPGHSVHRMHALPARTGQALMARLMSRAESLGIPVLTKSLVNEIWIQDDKIIGIGIQRANAGLEHYSCDSLVLCCNGYAGNSDLVRQYIPEMKDAIFSGHTGNDGSAILWGEELGAELADLGAYQGHGSWAIPHGILMTWALMMHGGLQVNSLGKRFHNETTGYSEAAVEVLKQPGGVAWCVFDEKTYQLACMFPDFQTAIQIGAIKRFTDTASLSDFIDCSQESIEETLGQIQTDLSFNSGLDTHTGRVFTKPILAPYYAVKVTGALFHTQGGLSIDDKARVLRKNGVAFANLFAAGGAARGVSGNAVWGYLSGNGLLSAFAGAYIAACSINEVRR